ncbi:MAG: amidase [Novosphingobium sp.]|nr:amidase [Novosphingobium sp.]
MSVRILPPHAISAITVPEFRSLSMRCASTALCAVLIVTSGCSVGSQGGSAIGVAPAAPQSAAGPAEAATRAALARISDLNPRLRAVIATDPTAIDQARAVDRDRAIGPLAGQPLLIKDNIETEGPLPTTAGSLALLKNVTGRDAPLVARLRDAGAIIVGKANLSEWANIRSSDSISGWSAVGGQTRNPYALDRNACGSSTGSAVAVASGMVRLAIGTETNGSITCPAAVNGVVGFKPTVGLVSRTHVIPISVSQDTAGPIAATVREAAQLLTAIAGSDPADPATVSADERRIDYAAALDAGALRGKRIGVMRFASGFGTGQPFDAALALLRAQGATLVEIREFDRKDLSAEEFKVLLSEFKVGLNDYLRTSPAPLPVRSLADVIAYNRANPEREMVLFGQDILEQAEKTKGLADATFKQARNRSFELAGKEGIDRLLREHKVDALVGPTVAAAWKIDAVHGDQIAGGGAGGLAAVAGYPHLTVPMGQVKGLPVGLSFLGSRWSDALILSLGYAYEQARGPLPPPTLPRSIEDRPDIARALEPQR